MKSLLILLTCLFGTFAFSQDLDWVAPWGGTDQDRMYGMDQDSLGNVYVVGSFRGQVDFDPGPATYPLISAGSYDIYIQKLDSSGNFIWAHRFGDIYIDGPSVVKVDAGGNVYVTGIFHGMVDFDPGPATTVLNGGLGRHFVLKMDAGGNLVWAHAGAAPGTSNGLYLDLSPAGDVFVAGYFDGTMDFDPSSGTASLTASVMGKDGFLQKLDANGNFVWVRHLSGYDNEQYVQMTALPGGEVALYGSFAGVVDFDPGPGTYNLVAPGNGTYFVQKLDANGQLVWANRMMGTAASLYASGEMASDAQGNIYLTGNFSGTADFDPSTATMNVTSAGGWDAFLLRINPNGQLAWVNTWGTSGFESGNGLTVMDDGRILVAGQFSDSLDFDPSPATYQLAPQGLGDLFLLETDTNGTFHSVLSIGGSFLVAGLETDVDPWGNILIGGNYFDTIDFDPGPGIFQGVAQGDVDLFVLKLGAICNGNPPQATITQSGGVLYAQPTNATFQWLDCDTQQPIPGATGPSFPFSGAGAYAVVVTQFGCVDTSACMTVVGRASSADMARITVAPNPGAGQVMVEFGERLAHGEVRIRDMQGKLVLERSFEDAERIPLTFDGPAGTFLLEVRSADRPPRNFRIVRQ